ncbi:hypothetical protein HAX54_022317 [Datura stramonium]|uniref:Putative plant transposon protein domain-containing protein n=1 Tax=Datura stramonium TaxID=4076 RepID=A0ABS8UWH8_DATST|nr:hypothetical protein [Datura stramonium]
MRGTLRVEPIIMASPDGASQRRELSVAPGGRFVFEVISEATGASFDTTHIFKRDLWLQEKFWWNIMCRHIFPIKSDNKLTHGLAPIMVVTIDKKRVDIWQMLSLEIKERALQEATSLSCPCLVTTCNTPKVPKIRPEN